jgi:hypothetical protein
VDPDLKMFKTYLKLYSLLLLLSYGKLRNVLLHGSTGIYTVIAIETPNSSSDPSY